MGAADLQRRIRLVIVVVTVRKGMDRADRFTASSSSARTFTVS
jgi:hypothetical protein